ncbi:hypothetical protein [Roseateles sp. P5_E7]
MRWLALAVFATTGAAHAVTFFEPCEAALKTPPFKALQAFYAGKPELPNPDACFRLNNREFLVTVTDTAPIAQGLYFFDAGTSSYDFPDGAQRRAIKVKMEFDEQRSGKHFALLETSSLSGGEWFTGYQVLFLQPGKGTGSFALQRVLEVQADPESGMCGTHVRKGSAAEVKSVRPESDGQPLTLVFHLAEQRCPAGPTRQVEKRFVWDGQRFQLQR